MTEYGWITTGDGRQVYRRIDASPPAARSSLPFPMVITDDMDPVQSQLDGKFYTSKAMLRATYRAAGVVEVGNDPSRLTPPKRKPPDRKAIRETVDKAIAKFSRGERVQRQGKA